MLCSLMDTAVCLSDAISDKIGSREFPDGRSFPCVWTLFAHWNIHALSPGLFEEWRALLKHPQVHSFTADEQTISYSGGVRQYFSILQKQRSFSMHQIATRKLTLDKS
ncbi:hypothetical protein CDAR_594451 [Caerostris darwini]|uniref:Uncharacterized protein n=1 Tax=Caerostris darwini TaxID=1538125 RepID=A0AAV4P744_9ARAC|nr:hypothetical protein CDAR_594451 [Caerostris darwini]